MTPLLLTNDYKMIPHTGLLVQVNTKLKMKRLSTLIVSFLPALAAAIVSTGCVSEVNTCNTRVDIPQIPPLDLPYGGEVEVKTIEFYVFDNATGLLVDVIRVPEEDIRRGSVDIAGRLSDGSYTFIAWGDSDADLSRSYMPVQMNDAATNDYESPKIGVTTIENFFLLLVTDDLSEEVLGDVIPATYDFDDLYYAKLPNVTISSGNVSTSTPLSFVSNNNTLVVTFTGLENVPSLRKKRLPPSDGVTRAEGDPLDVFVLGKNGRYNANNEIDTYAQTVRYEPQYLDYNVEGETISVIIKTMRLDIARHTMDPMLLYVRDESGDVVPPLDLLHAILQIEDENGEQMYRSQAAIDRQAEFDIKVNFTEVTPDPDDPEEVEIGVEITINGWEIVILYPVVQD
jgi:hypothetical protein